MARISSYLLDAMLSKLDTEATHIYICSAEPTTFAQATTTYMLGSKSGIAISAPADRTPNGREVTLSAISDGVTTNSGLATHFAITDNTNSRLLYSAALSANQNLTAGNPWTSNSIKLYLAGVV